MLYEVITLLDHLRNEIKIPLDRRRSRLKERVLILFGDIVGAQALDDVKRVRHRLDLARIDRAHGLDHAEHAVQSLDHRRGFFGTDREPRQAGDSIDLVFGRITSYNVCYTKLLRNSCVGIPTFAFRFGRFPRLAAVVP